MHIVNSLFLFILLACLVSCASTPPAGQLSRKEVSAKEKKEEIGQVQTLRLQIRSRLEQREFLKALRFLQQEVNGGTSEASLAEEYRLALRGGMNHIDELLKKEQFSQCGIYARQLLNLYPHNSAVVPDVSAEQIRQKLNFCSDQLMASGLAAYRAGEMQQAIDFWTALLVFDPERIEAKKAIETCTIQLRNLKAKP